MNQVANGNGTNANCVIVHTNTGVCLSVVLEENVQAGQCRTVYVVIAIGNLPTNYESALRQTNYILKTITHEFFIRFHHSFCVFPLEYGDNNMGKFFE